MALETLSIDHLPPNYRVHAALFRDVHNPDFLHAQLLARNNAYDFAFIDASSVISRLHLLSAIFRGLTTLADGTLTATTPHAEIVLSFGVNNNVCHPLLLSPTHSEEWMLNLAAGNRSRTLTDDMAYRPRRRT